MNILTVKNIKSGYDNKPVVDGISFSLQKGEFCALLGLNGCGKSTLLKTLSGLIPVKSGMSTIMENPYLELNEKDRARVISYIPQRGSSIFGRTALDVVLMGFNSQMGLLDNYSKRQKEEAREALRSVGFEIDGNIMYEELSEGQKQLVILARTLVQNTPVILMDEPDSALDFTNKNKIMESVRELIKKEGKTGLIALHDPDMALCYCDRILLMKDGRILFNIDKASMSNMSFLQTALSEIYGGIRIIDNDGIPVMVKNLKA